jgi:hypothetical protein
LLLIDYLTTTDLAFRLRFRLLVLVLLPLLVGLSSCKSAAPKAPTDEGLIRGDIGQLLARQTAAWNRGDVAGFMVGYWQSDSLVFIGKKGMTYGWQPTLDNYRKNYPDAAAMGQLTFSNLRITPDSPGTAHVVGRWHLARPQAGNLQGHFLLVLRYLAGSWVIVADHSS